MADKRNRYYKDMTPDERKAYDDFHAEFWAKERAEQREKPLLSRVEWENIITAWFIILAVMAVLYGLYDFLFLDDPPRKTSSGRDCTWDVRVGHNCP